jgi:hypothetical protein
MAVIFRPIFKVIMMIVMISITYSAFIMIQLFSFIWRFKFIEYHEFFTNKESITVKCGLVQKVQDKNIWETLNRWWNLEFYGME